MHSSANIVPYTPPSPQNPFIAVGEIFQKTTQRLIQGTLDLFAEFKEAEEIKKIKRKQGEIALSYTQYNLLNNAKEDFYKLLKVGLTLPLSPQFFFYSYIVFPMMTPTNPWAWRAFPSTYDKDTNDIQTRKNIIHNRKTEGFFKAITQLQHDVNEENNDDIKQQKIQYINSLKQSLQASSIEQSMNILSSWCQTEVNKANKLTLHLRSLPSSLVYDFARAVGKA